VYSLALDIFEPRSIETVLSQSLNVARCPLQSQGLADYYWEAIHRETIERKQGGELIGQAYPRGRLDGQLRKYIISEVRVTLLCEGLISPASDGGCLLWGRRGDYYVRLKSFKRKYISLMAYLWSIQKRWGIQTVFTSDPVASALAIGAIVTNSHKTISDTLNPYSGARPLLSAPNPYIETLIGLSGAHIGEVTAKKVLSHYSTPFLAFTEDVASLRKALGKNLADRILQSIGRATP